MAKKKSGSERVLNEEVLVLNFDPDGEELITNGEPVTYAVSTQQYKLFESTE